MDITALNFLESLPIVQESIRSADFLCLDTEFSGLSVGYEDNGHDFDTVESKYQKLRWNCERMNAFQIGFTTFKWDQKK